ncbi:hypothetical protein [Sulfobacillus harzensis]|uniref:Uncharacterized protein n=1 Tax=Sulfobacillus harzensis TaxID=2729629 RepID=A0A7Y0L5S3_9FIRM|nr:hypothetical protein [Sulfobacillus harzensis]NMP23467.1 hypothetical protein [Sulfobacillus harzensis]
MRQQPGASPSRDDIVAILRAHRDLGPEFDEHLADQILDLTKTEAPTSVPVVTGRTSRSRSRRLGPIFALSIPLMAIAGGKAGTIGILAVVALDIVALIASLAFWAKMSTNGDLRRNLLNRFGVFLLNATNCRGS